jgi:putative heme degradation protein
MPARKNLPVSVEGRTPALVPVEQLVYACNHTRHITRLHDRITHAVEEHRQVALSESEAVLLLAELRHRARRDRSEVRELLTALAPSGDVQAHVARNVWAH